MYLQVTCTSCHVDFEGKVTGDDVGVVANDLPANLVPELRGSANPTTIKNFGSWYVDTATTQRFNHNISLINRNPLCNTKDGDGIWDPVRKSNNQ